MLVVTNIATRCISIESFFCQIESILHFQSANNVFSAMFQSLALEHVALDCEAKE